MSLNTGNYDVTFSYSQMRLIDHNKTDDTYSVMQVQLPQVEQLLIKAIVKKLPRLRLMGRDGLLEQEDISFFISPCISMDTRSSNYNPKDIPQALRDRYNSHGLFRNDMLIPPDLSEYLEGRREMYDCFKFSSSKNQWVITKDGSAESYQDAYQKYKKIRDRIIAKVPTLSMLGSNDGTWSIGIMDKYWVLRGMLTVGFSDYYSSSESHLELQFTSPKVENDRKFVVGNSVGNLVRKMTQKALAGFDGFSNRPNRRKYQSAALETIRKYRNSQMFVPKAQDHFAMYDTYLSDNNVSSIDSYYSAKKGEKHREEDIARLIRNMSLGKLTTKETEVVNMVVKNLDYLDSLKDKAKSLQGKFDECFLYVPLGNNAEYGWLKYFHNDNAQNPNNEDLFNLQTKTQYLEKIDDTPEGTRLLFIQAVQELDEYAFDNFGKYYLRDKSSSDFSGVYNPEDEIGVMPFDCFGSDSLASRSSIAFLVPNEDMS